MFGQLWSLLPNVLSEGPKKEHIEFRPGMMLRIDALADPASRSTRYDDLRQAQRTPSEDFAFLSGARNMPSSGLDEVMRIMGMAPAPRPKTEREIAIEELEAACGPLPNAWEWTV